MPDHDDKDAEIERLGRDYQTARDAHDSLLAEIERLRAILKEVDDWIRDLAPYANDGDVPVPVFQKVRAALTGQEESKE